MPEISSATRPKLVDTSIDIGEGESLAIRFDRNKVTPAWMEVAGKRDEQHDALSMPKALADVIVGWDMTSGGQPFPPTVENIALLSFETQHELLTSVFSASQPSDAEGKALSVTPSTASSDSTPVLPMSQNGPATSPLPAVSASQSPT